MKLNGMKFLPAFVVFLFGILMFISCNNSDKVQKQINHDQLYFDYTITAEEGGVYATCLLQFKENNLDGNAINVSPGKVELDGQTIEGDSAGLSGYYYEVQKPIDSFAGKHTIIFTRSDDQQFKEEFEFTPFTLTEELPEKISRKAITIQLKNFPYHQATLRLLMLDTAFVSKGFNDTVAVVNGQIKIDESILNNLKNGPITMELYMEKEMPLQQHTNAGGRLSITYGLKREFELMD